MGYFRALHGIASVINLEKLSKDLDKECRAALKVKNAYDDFLLNSIFHLFSLLLLFSYWFSFLSRNLVIFFFILLCFLSLFISNCILWLTHIYICIYIYICININIYMYIYTNIYAYVPRNIFIVLYSDVVSSSHVIIKNILSYYLFSCFVIGTWCTPSFRIIWRCICI